MPLFFYLFTLLVSVGAMTVFSALMSVQFKCEFREHILLAKLISNKSVKQKENITHLILGWFVHFFIGGIFLGIYVLLWNYTELVGSLLGSTVYGFLIGILGVLGWRVLFKINTNPPETNYKLFYAQLIVAHIVFSLANFSVFLALY